MDKKQGTEGQRILAIHKVLLGGFWNTWPRFPKELYVTDQAIFVKGKVEIPYNALVQISGPSGGCILEYRDELARQRKLRLIPYKSFHKGVFGDPTKEVELYKDIVQASRHRIRQTPDKKLVELAERLREIGVESEFMEPQVQDDLTERFGGASSGTASSWARDLGGLKFSGKSMDSMRVTEVGHVEVGHIHATEGTPGAYGRMSSVSVKRCYLSHYIIQIRSSSRIACKGEPKKRFLLRVVDYTWTGSKLAERLNQDAQLRNMLIKAKALPMHIKTNHIYSEGEKGHVP